MYACMYVCMYACIYECLFVYACMHARVRVRVRVRTICTCVLQGCLSNLPATKSPVPLSRQCRRSTCLRTYAFERPSPSLIGAADAAQPRRPRSSTAKEQRPPAPSTSSQAAHHHERKRVAATPATAPAPPDRWKESFKTPPHPPSYERRQAESRSPPTLHHPRAPLGGARQGRPGHGDKAFAAWPA